MRASSRDLGQYQIRNINVVNIVSASPWLAWIIGALFILGGLGTLGNKEVGSAFIALLIGGAIIYFSRPKHTLVLNTSSGAIQSYTSPRIEEVSEIRQALNTAMANLA